MYHYGGNNPIKYTDPTGEAIAVIPFIAPTVIAGAKAIGAWLASLFVVGTAATAVGVTLDAAIDGSKSESQEESPQSQSPLVDSNVSPSEDDNLEYDLNAIDLQNLPEGWTSTKNKGHTHIRDDTGNIRIRIDPPDGRTQHRHKHLYDRNGNSLDKNGNIVDRKSPEAHIPVE